MCPLHSVNSLNPNVPAKMPVNFWNEFFAFKNTGKSCNFHFTDLKLVTELIGQQQEEMPLYLIFSGLLK